MNDIEKKVTPEENPEIEAMSDEVIDQTLVQIRPGQVVTGKVVQITEDEVCVNIGYKADGIVKKTDLSSTDVKIDDEIEVEVVKVNDGEGNVLLSQKNIINRKAWEEIVAKQEAGEFVEGVGKEAVKGGLLADVAGIRTFIPASQLSLRYVEKIDEFVGQNMTLKIIEIDKAKKRIVASRKAVLMVEEAEKKKKIWESLEVGSIVKGTVRRLADFGAFVDIGGVDGLVHVTDLSWARVGHPSEVVSVNQPIDVKILKLDPERDRISLSYKATLPKPWDVAGEKYIPGTIVTGKVVRIIDYGAFVELEPGLDGMVHISQCALTRIAKVEDAVKVGDIIRVKILSVDTEAKRISLSIRQALEDEAFESVNNTTDAADEFAIDDEQPVEIPETTEE
jgi:4-hydroxy-3-methylbut-2-enyl diphosphate reductase